MVFSQLLLSLESRPHPAFVGIARVQNFIALATIAIATTVCAPARADVELMQIGNPLFEPTDFAYGSATLDKSWRDEREFWDVFTAWTSKSFGRDHVLGIDGVIYPGDAHDGPYEQEARRALAGSGGINTDVLTVSDLKGRNIFSNNFTYVPSENAPIGDSPDGSGIPVIPDDVFPLNIKSVRKFNGLANRSSSFELPSLKNVGRITDEFGEIRDFTKLSSSHETFFGAMYADPEGDDSDLIGDWTFLVELRDVNGDGWDIIRNIEVVGSASNIKGDLSHDGQLDIHDLTILMQNVAVHAINSKLDMNGDEAVDVNDVNYWVTDLKSSWMGDANLDGHFNSSDFVEVFKAGKYETDQLARWNEGDWNADERFDSSDFVAAFKDGGYEQGPRTSVLAVPEPSAWILLTIGLTGTMHIRRKL